MLKSSNSTFSFQSLYHCNSQRCGRKHSTLGHVEKEFGEHINEGSAVTEVGKLYWQKSQRVSSIIKPSNQW